MSAKSNNKRIEIPTEFFFIILETDSNCHVSEVHCYSDSKLRDSSYYALSEVTKQDFTNWNPQKLRNKIIIIPVLSSAPSDGDYKHLIFSDLFWPTIRKKNIIIEKNRTIMTKILLYSVPTRTI